MGRKKLTPEEIEIRRVKHKAFLFFKRITDLKKKGLENEVIPAGRHYKNYMLERIRYVYRIDTDLLDDFKQKCEELGYKRSEVLRMMIYDYINNENFFFLQSEINDYFRKYSCGRRPTVKELKSNIKQDKLDCFVIEKLYIEEFDRLVFERTGYKNKAEFIRILIKTFIKGFVTIKRDKIRTLTWIDAKEEAFKILFENNFDDYKKII